jgi:acetyl-CoA synthetase
VEIAVMGTPASVDLLERYFADLSKDLDPLDQWPRLVDGLRQTRAQPQQYLSAWERLFANWETDHRGPRPIWIPSDGDCERSNLKTWMNELGIENYAQFHQWSVANRAEFWQQVVWRVGIRFRKAPKQILDLSQGVEHPIWFGDAMLNIVESCFQAPEENPAINYQQPGQPLQTMSYAQLRAISNRVSNGLRALGCQVGDAIAVVLPMTALSVPIYLGIVQAGCRVVSIADSFAPPEIAMRLKIANARLVFTYDFHCRSGKRLELYSRVAQADSTSAIVIPVGDSQRVEVELRSQDRSWHSFLSDNTQFDPVSAKPDETINILFSSGTTGEPKAIPWSHLTPIKCAVDGYCHQNIQPGWVCTWPTNLGWMMGPWLIFATLINRGTIGLYEDAPVGKGFGAFIEAAKVNLLGVVPTIVKAWKSSGDMESFDWSSIQVFSSTGESSQAADMVYLSALAQIKPIIEYCGGTEIGGGYITSTVLEPNYPAAFNTPAVGIDFVLIDEQGSLADEGELFLIPPSIGLSQKLLNRDHHETYFEGAPRLESGQMLRRHGDHFRRVHDRVYQAGGRVDDTMNLGGIKISSAEIERVLNQLSGITETAAVAYSKNGGPEELIVFVVGDSSLQPVTLLPAMNNQLKSQLNPLFKVSQIELVPNLPRTASGKVMRRELRAKFKMDS